MAGVIRAMRQEEPPAATDARVLEMLSSMEAQAPPIGGRAGYWMFGGTALVALAVAIGAIVVWPRSESPQSHETARLESPDSPLEQPEQLEQLAQLEREEEPIDPPSTTPEIEEPRQAPVIARTRSPTSDAVPPEGPSEEELILEARRAIPRDLTRASSLLTRHARLYPRGVMVEERDALRIEVLLARGERERAVTQFERWRRRYPNSAHTLRLARMLEASSSN